jgi:diguanylate cyclase (GGDEF)-like protein
MTGLANHRSFQEEWQRQIARAERYRSPLSLLLFDVDHFKKYNDAFGHPAGDEVLRTVGRLLRTITREGDYPARYGGEEFAVILPDQDAETAQTVGERIREVIVSHTFAHREITISVGVAQHIASEAAGATIQRADVALYESKAAGRNRVTYLPTEGECPIALQVGSWAVDQEAGQDSDRTDAPAFEVVQTTEEAPPARRQTPFETLRLLSWQFGGLEGMLQDPLEPTLAALLDILDRRNGEPTGHAERVTRYTIRLAQELSTLYEERRDERPLLPYLTPFDFKTLAYGALLHDLGKMGIPEATLRKSGDLTEAEWRQIRRHPLVGASLLKGYPTLEAALPIVRYHHECWDGSGYPQGLKGETIPLSARIFALCDTFENLTTDKSYRKRFDFAAACQEIRNRAGTQFDPDAVTAFLRIPSEEWLRLSEPIAEPECDAFADAA